MDAFSGIVAWLLVVFLQTCPTDHLADGQVYTYLLDSKARRVSISVEAFDAKAKSATLIAQLEPVIWDSQPRTHSAELSWGSGRKITAFKIEGNEVLETPLVLPRPGLIMSTDPNDLFAPSKTAPTTIPKSAKVEGAKSEVKPKAARYEHDKDYAELGTDPALGLVSITLSQWGEISNVQLVKIKR